MDIQEQILSAFQVEHREQVEGIRSILASLEQEQAGSNDPRWDEAFRMAHTLKGGARVCDLRDLESLGHRMESLFACVRQGALAYTSRIGETLNRALDAIEDWMAMFTAGQSPPSPADALAAIERLLEEAKGAAAVEPRVAAPNADAPPADEPGTAPAGVREIETLRVETRHLDSVLRAADALMAVNPDCERVVREMARLSEDIGRWERHCVAVRQAEASTLRQMGANPDFENVARHVEEMAQHMRRIARRQRLIRDAHVRAARTLQVVSDDLRESVRQTRMVAAEGVWQGLRHMVRKLARDEKKEVEFVADGLQARADRMVLQQLKDPLIHALRNAIVHGIETPDERAAQAKPRAGKIQLTLRTRGARLHVVVEDDGRGIDLKRVRREAEQRGLLSEAAAGPGVDPEQLARLLFLPTFSTSAAVSELAGRGMGLSVVYEAVLRLRGSVRIGPRPGSGAVLEVSVPLYVSAERVLLVSCGGQALAIPVSALERLVRVRSEDAPSVDGQRMALVDGAPLMLVDLARAIGRGASSRAGETLCVAVLRSATRRVGAVVDSFLAERETLIKDLDEWAVGVGPFMGAVVLEDNEVALVLDPSGLRADSSPATAATPAAQSPGVERTPTILVVDDSFTTRTLERSILETNGFHVRVAVDGLEALGLLRTEPVDLVVADIEMPKMDGLALLREMREDARYRSLPVILVTSLDRAEDRQRGMELGANAYIAKRRFDHQELLDTIRRFL